MIKKRFKEEEWWFKKKKDYLPPIWNEIDMQNCQYNSFSGCYLKRSHKTKSISDIQIIDFCDQRLDAFN